MEEGFPPSTVLLGLRNLALDDNETSKNTVAWSAVILSH